MAEAAALRAPATAARPAAAIRRGRDDLGLRRALSKQLLPLLVAAMAFLAALAVAGSIGASALAGHWQSGAGASLTIQIPSPDAPAATDARANPLGTRQAAVLALLAPVRGMSVHVLNTPELDQMLRPWLGADASRLALPLPSVVMLHLSPGTALPADLAQRLATAAPGVRVEEPAAWQARLARLARAAQRVAGLALLLVGLIATAVVAVAVRAALAARRESIEIVHLLGATDGLVAGQFAARTMRLAGLGGLAGAGAAAPVLMHLGALAAPFVGGQEGGWLPLPGTLLAGLVALPFMAAGLGWLTAQVTVRRWLRRLP